MLSESCPHCGARRTGALRFCQSCGFDFDLAPSETGPRPVPQPNVLRGAVTSAPPAQGRRTAGRAWLVVIPLAVAALAVAVVAGAGLYATGVIPHRHDVLGSYLLINLNPEVPRFEVAGSTCRGAPGSSGIGPATVVSVEDATGTVLGSSTLGTGALKGTGCEWMFTLHDLPEVASYTFNLAGQTIQTLTLDEMNRGNWAVAWSVAIGDMPADLNP